jgi:hypothetical protein
VPCAFDVSFSCLNLKYLADRHKKENSFPSKKIFKKYCITMIKNKDEKQHKQRERVFILCAQLFLFAEITIRNLICFSEKDDSCLRDLGWKSHLNG